MTLPSGVILTLVSLLAGWIGLFPARHALGARGYHLAAYPLGLLGWPVAVSVMSLVGKGFHPLPYYAAYVVVLFVVLSSLSRRGEGTPAAVPVWGYVVWGSVLLGVASVVSVSGLSSFGYDSVFHYEAWGTWLSKTGTLSQEIFSAYGLFMPSVHAMNRYFGGDWTSTPYPLLSVHTAAIFLCAVRAWSRRRVSNSASWIIAVGSLGLLISSPRYLHHTLYVHSHMFTAAYLILAVWATLRAYRGEGDAAESTSRSERQAWLVVAGLAAAGTALTRTDGLAYLIVPALVATLAWLEGGHEREDQLVYVASLAAPVALVYLPAFVHLRFWPGSSKLSGKKAAAILAALGVLGGSTLVLGALGRISAWLRKGRRLLWLIVAGDVFALLALFLLKPEDFTQSCRNMVTNLFYSGQNGHLWYFAAGVVLVSLLYRGQWRSGQWPSYLLFAIFQFLLVAVVVHGAGHPGRLNTNDSFNRASFHVIPLIFWYAALVATSILQEFTTKDTEVPA